MHSLHVANKKTKLLPFPSLHSKNDNSSSLLHRANKSRIMANYESDNTAVSESLAQVQGRMDLFQGNMETILKILQTQRASTSANPAAGNITHVVGVRNATIIVDATIETQVETVAPTTGNCQLVPTILNKLTASYP